MEIATYDTNFLNLQTLVDFDINQFLSVLLEIKIAAASQND